MMFLWSWSSWDLDPWSLATGNTACLSHFNSQPMLIEFVFNWVCYRQAGKDQEREREKKLAFYSWGLGWGSSGPLVLSLLKPWEAQTLVKLLKIIKLAQSFCNFCGMPKCIKCQQRQHMLGIGNWEHCLYWHSLKLYSVDIVVFIVRWLFHLFLVWFGSMVKFAPFLM